MAGLGLSISPGALLLAAFLFFIGGGPALTAFLTAMLAHELGHLFVLYLVGASIQGIGFTAAGPVIRYGGVLTKRQEMGVVAAGPVAGLLFAALCFISGSAYFRYAGAIALLATMFNLLPVLPMDGGRLALFFLEMAMPPRTAELILRVFGNLCAFGVFLTGLKLLSPAAAAAGIWMAVLANVPDLR